ncbi:MAG: glycosyltransferase [Planctomycetota bacterium]
MKILQFVCDGSPGGGTNHVNQLLHGLRHELDCALLTERDSYLYHLAKQAGFNVYGGEFFRGRLDRNAMTYIRDLVRDIKPDLIHCHGGRAAFFQSFMDRDVPAIYTVHGFHFARKNFFPRSFGWMAEFHSIRRMSHIIFVSEYDRRLAVQRYLLPRGKSHSVIHNGIEPLPPACEKQRRGIGFLGRLVHQKNPELFLDIAERMPEHQFLLAGGGELEPKIRKEIDQRNLKDRVKLLGSLDHAQAIEFISKLQVLVMTPRWEGLPLLLLEAMFLRVPVISTAVGGVPEVIQHGQTGLLADSGTADQFVSHIESLLGKHEFRKRLVDRARSVAETSFSQEKMLDETYAAYVNITPNHPPIDLTSLFGSDLELNLQGMKLADQNRYANSSLLRQ